MNTLDDINNAIDKLRDASFSSGGEAERAKYGNAADDLEAAHDDVKELIDAAQTLLRNAEFEDGQGIILTQDAEALEDVLASFGGSRGDEVTKPKSSWLHEGQRVAVLNRTMGGKFIVEGYAKVCTVIDEYQAEVRFETGDTSVVSRFIDPSAQGDPEVAVAKLNGELVGVTDTDAMNHIHAILDGNEWDSDTAGRIAAIVESTGRTVRAFDEVGEEED